LSVTGYAGFASPFTTSQEIVDANGTVQALFWKDGAMEPKLNAITPFKVSPPTLVDNCTRLKIRMGVINYCDLEKNAAISPAHTNSLKMLLVAQSLIFQFLVAFKLTYLVRQSMCQSLRVMAITTAPTGGLWLLKAVAWYITT
jgi:hypothetical protein